MKDIRLDNTNIFELRSNEWNLENIRNKIIEIFRNVNILDNYKYLKTEWAAVSDSKRIEDLKKHVFKTLKIYVAELTKDKNVKKVHIYNIQIPVLINNQYFHLAGLLKIPVFQLYDFPIIHRKVNSGKILKFKNNVLTAVLNTNRKTNFNVDLFLNHMKLNKNIPLELLICNLYTKEEFKEFLNTLSGNNKDLKIIEQKCNNLWNTKNKTKLLEELGSYRNITAISDDLKKGQSIVFSLKYAYDIDIFTKKYMKTNSILFELLKAMDDGYIEDNDLKNKRLRFSEYILSVLIKNVYDMICSLNYSKKIKFRIPPNIIMDVCNVSSIIHHSFNYNPVGEIASLLQCSLIGPGSFKKENVPSYMKGIHDSQKGRICPADTPDRDGCGVILNMVPSVNIKKDGTFEEKISDIYCSYPISMVPFAQNDDQTRLQMASSQLKQSILLNNAEKPLIKTGSENRYAEYTSFKRVAKFSGRVIYKDESLLIVRYNRNSKIEVFQLGYRPMYLNSIDYLYTNLEFDDRFEKDDVITQSKFIQDDEITLGQNLLTAINIWEGYNYEDGIILNEKVKDKFTSKHYLDLSFTIDGGQILLSLKDDEYYPLPRVGEKIKKGSVYAKLKHMHDENFESINIEPNEFISPQDCEIVNIEIIPTSWNKQIAQFNNFIENHLSKQKNKINDIKNVLSNYITKSEMTDLFIQNNITRYDFIDKCNIKFSEKGEKINGVKVIIKAMYDSPIELGDKITNRHGGKGVISKFVPDEEMPTLPDGRKVEIILNPLGIISRLNVGQLYELHLTEALNNIKINLKNKIDEKLSKPKNIKNIVYELKKYLDIVDNTRNRWGTLKILKDFRKDCKNLGISNAIDRIQFIQPVFQSISPDNLIKIMDITKSKYKMKLYNPKKDKYFINDIAVGYMYFNKLIHRSSDKLAARSIGSYSKSTLQPVSGKKRGGGLKLGEMELWALMAHGADDTIKDFLTTYSDSAKNKNKLLSDILKNPELEYTDNSTTKPNTLRLLESYFTILGMKIKN